MVLIEVGIMILTSIWYHSGDKHPPESGHYVGYKLPTFGDDSEGYDMFYWDNEKREWREFRAPHGSTIIVSYWTECPEIPDQGHVNSLDIPTVAEIDAWKNVEDAISKYNMVKELSR